MESFRREGEEIGENRKRENKVLVRAGWTPDGKVLGITHISTIRGTHCPGIVLEKASGCTLPDSPQYLSLSEWRL